METDLAYSSWTEKHYWTDGPRMLEDSDGASVGAELRYHHEYMNMQITITHTVEYQYNEIFGTSEINLL